MLNMVRAVVHEGKIELPENVSLPDGTKVVVTVLSDTDDDDREFWRRVSEYTLAKIWDNEADDVYAELLKK